MISLVKNWCVLESPLTLGDTDTHPSSSPLVHHHDSGVIADAELYGLFSCLIPASATSTNGDLERVRDRQGLVPDLYITFPSEHVPSSGQLVEIKALSAGATWYQSNQKAMDQRAKRLPNEYLNKARNIDINHHCTSNNQEGPLEQRLKGFGELQCLVAGQYGEVSQHFHDLLEKTVTSKSNHITQVEGCHLSDSERGLLLHQMRRRLSISIIRSQSSCLLSRLGRISPGAKDAAKCRAVAKQRAESNLQDQKAHFQAHIRGRRIHERVGTLWISYSYIFSLY